ncbi:unnamed protein product [Sphagnum jensenii]|uniref:Uncharacterized protein n=1 Tax=Sphagnum jensenii TaxID=128206 RepID=A0ABP0VDJ5_9BRYO
MGTTGLLSKSCQVLEFITRVSLVNIPSYLQAMSPELDRVCSMTFAYLTMQVVGFSGALLCNASFTLACRIAYFLPPLFDSPVLEGTTDVPSNSALYLVAVYYVSYASIRVMVGFAQGIFQIGLESIKDFPDACALLARGGLLTLQLAPVVFTPVIVLECALLLADPICSFPVNISGDPRSYAAEDWLQGSLADGAGFLCDVTGLRFLTSPYADVRRMVFSSLVVMVLQLWQAALLQFPQWTTALRELPLGVRTAAQLAVVVLSACSVYATAAALLHHTLPLNVLCVLLVGWTLWLCLFMPVLVRQQGLQWAARVTPASMQAFAANLRLSFVIILTLAFAFILHVSGVS